MTVTLPVNAERLVVQFLLDQSEVTALVGQRIYTTLPDGLATWPTLRVVRVGGQPVHSVPFVLDAATLQFDAWGGTKAQALTVIDTARAVIAERIIGTHAEGVVSAPQFGGLSFVPDDTYTPARPRYTADVVIFTHP